MPDFRALCARMADELDYYRQLLMDDRRETHALAAEARTALSEPEPERPTPQPADGEVAELVELLGSMAAEAELADQVHDASVLDRAINLLERLSPPQPVPVSKRLPEESLAWWFTPESDEEYGWWVFEPDGMEREPRPTHWLPAHALPLPS